MSAHTRVVTIVRWIAVLPGALIGAALLQFLLVVLHALINGTGDEASSPGHLLFRTVVNVAFGAVTVGLAWSIAPSHNGRTAIGVAVLFTAVSAVIWLAHLDVGAEWDRYATVVSVVAASVTALAVQRVGDPASHAGAHAAGVLSSS